MRKRLIVDIRDYASKIADREESSLTETIRKHKKAIIKDVQECIDRIPLHDPHITSKVSYKLDVKNREVVVTYEWDEQSNVNTWMHNVDKNLIRICDYLWVNTPFKCYTHNTV